MLDMIRLSKRGDLQSPCLEITPEAALLYPLPCQPFPNDGLMMAGPLLMTGGAACMNGLAGAVVLENCLWPLIVFILLSVRELFA